MNALKMIEGELQFDNSIVDGIEEFLQEYQTIMNQLKI